MRKHIVFILLSLCPLASFEQNVEEILKINKDKFKRGSLHTFQENSGEIIPIPTTRGDATIPSNYSLKSYVPKVALQMGGSCMCYAAAYYGMTIFERNLTKNNTSLAYDPMNLYGRILSFLNVCDDIDHGSNPILALTLLKDYGGTTVEYVDSLFWACEEQYPLTNFTSKLNGWKTLNNSYLNIDKIKYALANGHPIVGGISTNLSLTSYDISFFNMFSNPTNDLTEYIDLIRMFCPSDCENMTDAEILKDLKKIQSIRPGEDICWSGKLPTASEGRHAMCIIGYDDKKFGGAFEIVNSWGDDWGNGGYIWITYRDFYKMYPEFYMIGN